MKGVCIGLILGWAVILVVSGAEAAGATSRWEVLENEPETFGAVAWCSTFRQKIKITDLAEPQEVCMFGGGTFQFGLYGQNGFQLVAKHFLDNDFRFVTTACRYGCQYIPSEDLLVVRRPGNSLQTFQRASERISLAGDTRYEFDTTSPAYSLSDNVGAFAVSQNGEWLAVEVRNSGVDLINLKSLQRGRVIRPGVLYGFGRDPVEELAVSNDGRYVAQMGVNAGFTIVETTEQCRRGERSCVDVSMSTAEFAPSFYFAGHPRFDYDSGRLSFLVATYGQGSRRVVIQRSDYQPNFLNYLALGDSFTSGEGEIDDRFYRQGVGDIFGLCHQSQRSYPFLLGVRMGLKATESQSVACAGAKIEDLAFPSAHYKGQGSKLSHLSDFEQESLKSEALEAFLPGRVPQARFVERYLPEIITVGVGGNDAGLMGKLKVCAMPDLCEWATDPVYQQATGLEIQRLSPQLKSLYQQILESSPGSQLFVIGYPEIIHPEGICDPIVSTLFSYGERAFMQQGIQHLNQVIRAAAQSTGAIYVDIEKAFVGHRLCEGDASAVNGLRFGDDVSPLSVLPNLKLIGNESFHPTPFGHERVAAAIGDLTDMSDCHCAQEQGIPPLSSYWDAYDSHSFAAFFNESMTSQHIPAHASEIVVTIASRSFVPHSQVRIEMHSEHHDAILVEAAADGGLETSVPIGTTLDFGYHTLHIFGTSYTNLPIDMYTIVSYGDEQSEPAREERIGTSKVIGGTILGVSVAAPHAVELLKEHSTVTLGDNSTPFLAIFMLAGFVAVLLIISGVIFKRRTKNSAQDRGG